MPWVPDFVAAVELVRRQTRATGQVDPVGQYVAALSNGDTRALEDSWPGTVVVYDPSAGTVRGHRQLRQFVKRSRTLLAARRAHTETVATTVAGERAVVELLLHLTQDDRELAWPIAVVAESPDDRSVVFRSYFSRRAFDGQRHSRPPVLGASRARPPDIVIAYQAALAAGDADAAAATFAADGYLREASGPLDTHRGAAELRAFFRDSFSSGGAIDQELCAVTDDGARCAVEYNCVRRESNEPAPQAGITVYESGSGGLLAAARVYDDVETFVDRS